MITKALRQYKHNDGSDGLVFSYDINVIDKMIHSLKSCENCDNSFVSGSRLDCKLGCSKSYLCAEKQEYKYWINNEIT